MASKFQNSGDQWISVPGTAGTFATPTQHHERVVVTEATSAVPITLPVRPGDFLTVLRDNLPLVEGVDFTRGEGHITLTDAAEPGTAIDIHLMHFEIAPTRGHVDDRGNPHGVTAAQLGDDALTEGGLLKLKGGKLTKAVLGTDYDKLECGVWTPVVYIGESICGCEWRSGRYAKLGKLVFVTCSFGTGAKPAGSDEGIVTIRGLPYTPDASVAVSLNAAWYSLGGETAQVQGWINDEKGLSLMGHNVGTGQFAGYNSYLTGARAPEGFSFKGLSGSYFTNG